MPDHRKLARILQFIVRLRAPFGCDKHEIAELFEVNVRTIERHIVLLRDLGFQIEQEGSRFFIRNAGKNKLKPEELITFSLEEALMIRNALLSAPQHGPMRNLLLDKLYALTDLEDLAETMSNLHQSMVITNIRKAIQNKEKIILKDYESSNSNRILDRMVEPIRFLNYFKYVSAFEPTSGKVKTFKTDRIYDVVLTGKKWEHEDKHLRKGMDVFGLTGEMPVKVTLILNRRARQLLCEEYPDAALFISAHGKKYVFATEVYSMAGVGRFVLGLIDEIKIIEPEALKAYIKEKINKF
ncbi:MAG: WYL domain-containing protein [Bacteroidetes bacterium]|nr:WYL domain-containing protein [Bacteroidota bacterium]